MKQSIASELGDDIEAVMGWMRERTSEELQAFVCRRLAVVEDEVLPE